MQNPELQNLKAYLLCHNADSNPLYSSWCSEMEHVVVEEYQEDWQPPEDCGVVVSHLHYDYPTAALLKRITDENQVPVLILADGILEFRNTFANPNVAAGSLFMPVHGHKIACIGPSQARHVESWGNHGKTEVVGLPRLDSLKGREQGNESACKRILVVTARQPGFTDRQLEKVQQSLADLRDWFGAQRHSGLVEPVWRLTGGLAEKIGVQQDPDPMALPIAELLGQVDAVVSTPSTTIIESMLMDLPTAVLDYTNSPRFVTTAWSISARDNIDQVMQELMSPSAAHLIFQHNSLADALQIEEPAAERMQNLVNSLIECRRKSLAGSKELEVPANILAGNPDSRSGLDQSAESMSLRHVFPNQVGFRANELEALTTQYDQLSRAVSNLHSRIEDQRNENAAARQQVRIANRHQEYLGDQLKWLRTEIQRLNLALRISRRPTRLHRRLRVRASIAFQRWQFFVEKVQNLSSRSRSVFCLNSLFELTGYPKGNKIPPTVRNHESNPRRNPQIKMWKVRPTNPLLRRMSRSVRLSHKRLKARRVMTAV